jgi:hypothetical protein
MKFKLETINVTSADVTEKLAEFRIDSDQNQVYIIRVYGNGWRNKEDWLKEHGAVRFYYEKERFVTGWQLTEELVTLFLLRWR